MFRFCEGKEDAEVEGNREKEEGREKEEEDGDREKEKGGRKRTVNFQLSHMCRNITYIYKRKKEKIDW